jgi:outer membrane autotransporter protein
MVMAVASGTGAVSFGIAANTVNIISSGLISGGTAIQAGATTNTVGPPGTGTNSVLVNSGTIIGTSGVAIDFSAQTLAALPFAGSAIPSSNDTLTLLPGSRILGDILLGTNDTVNISGGLIVNAVVGLTGDAVTLSGQSATFASTASVRGVAAFTVVLGSRLTFQVAGPAQAPMFSANAITLAGTLNVAPQGSLFAFGAHTTFKDVFVSGSPIAGSFTSVTTPITLFTASLSPDAVTANALDLTLALSPSGLVASAQDLTQDQRLGLDAPRVLTQAVQDRLVANGGALGEEVPGGAPPSAGASTIALGHANLWVRGYDQFGSASGVGAAPGYDVNRAAPLIGGVDWRFDNDIVAGVAATYVATSARFKDGSSTNVSSYQGAAYAGWAGGPWYAAGSVVASFNEFGTSRLLTPFGLPGDATSSPSGQSYQGHAEAGYHLAFPAGGVNVSVTPYAALDYVNSHRQGFSETGGFGALSVNSADSNSFQTTLGVRLTSRIAFANYGTLTPELRLGWNHEFLDASQTISASLVGVPGSGFSATGIAFGRDAALAGAGFSLELSPDAKVFVDYDGRVASRLQEHSISGGLRVRF